MSLSDLIFSRQRSAIFKRHFIFWLVYSTFFYIHTITSKVIFLLNYSNSFYAALVNLYCFLPVCVISVYWFLYYPLPRQVEKIRYIQFLGVLFGLYATFSVINYYTAILYFKNTGNWSEVKDKPLYVFSYGNNYVLLAIATGFFAATIKFTKNWYIKQKEILEMENQKAKAELHLLKTSIQPDFLFDSLNALQDNIRSSSPESPDMVLRFSEVLRYLLYDCDEEQKPLQEELCAIDKFLSLERIKMKGRGIIYAEHHGNTENNYIIPSLLLSFVQNCFVQLYDEKLSEFIVKIKTGIELRKLRVTFAFTQPDESKRHWFNWKEIVKPTEERLNKFYKNNYQLNIKEVKKQTIISLKLTSDTSRPGNLLPVTPSNEAIYETV